MNYSDNYTGLPEMMGTEHELSINAVYRTELPYIEKSDVLTPKEDRLNNLNYSIFKHSENVDEFLWTDSQTRRKLTKNGSIFFEYTDHPLEIATPECSSPKELLIYSNAARLLIHKWVESFLEDNKGKFRSISVHDRVVDYNGNTWGEHDNYSINPINEWELSDHNIPEIIWLHLMTRGCVSGAGHVNNKRNEWYMSQKLPTVRNIYGKEWGSTGYFTLRDRLEVRCSDKNISEWAHYMRIGSMALVLALAERGYSINALGLSDDFFSEKPIQAKDRLKINTINEVSLSYESKKAVSIQKHLAEAALNMIHDEGITGQYSGIAAEWYRHCDELDKASANNSALDLSKFIKTDWASKFMLIQNKINKDQSEGQERLACDYISLRQDLCYDRTLFDVPQEDGKIYVVEGYGQLLNNRVNDRKIIKKTDASRALQTPPAGSRAELRHGLLKGLEENNLKVDYYDWEMIEWQDENGDTNRQYF